MRRAAALLLALLLGACVSRTTVTERPPAASGVGPVLVLERFLQAANASDLRTMGRLFGTRDGSILERDPQDVVEERMFALASLLRHDDYQIVGDRPVPGRLQEAVRIETRLRQGERDVSVPFTLVQAGDGGWLVEEIGVEELGRRGGRSSPSGPLSPARAR